MAELVQEYPGAQRALFRAYHIGGCSSCGFRPEETLAQVCKRNDDLPVDQVIDTIIAGHEADQKMQISPKDREFVFVCHHGVRSLDAAAYFAGHGFENVRSLADGIDGWSVQVDPELP